MDAAFYHIEDPFETAGGAIVGVLDLSDPPVWRKVHEQPQFVFGPRRTDLGKIIEVALVHGKHVLEPQEIFGLDETGAQIAQIDPPAQGRLPGPLVRTLSDMIGVGSRRIGLDNRL